MMMANYKLSEKYYKVLNLLKRGRDKENETQIKEKAKY